MNQDTRDQLDILRFRRECHIETRELYQRFVNRAQRQIDRLEKAILELEEEKD